MPSLTEKSDRYKSVFEIPLARGEIVMGEGHVAEIDKRLREKQSEAGSEFRAIMAGVRRVFVSRGEGEHVSSYSLLTVTDIKDLVLLARDTIFAQVFLEILAADISRPWPTSLWLMYQQTENIDFLANLRSAMIFYPLMMASVLFLANKIAAINSGDKIVLGYLSHIIDHFSELKSDLDEIPQPLPAVPVDQ